MQMSKRKRTKPAKTKQEQAAEEGWTYVYAPRTIRRWNSIWVEGSREGVQGADEEITRRPYIPLGWNLAGINSFRLRFNAFRLDLFRLDVA